MVEIDHLMNSSGGFVLTTFALCLVGPWVVVSASKVWFAFTRNIISGYWLENVILPSLPL